MFLVPPCVGVPSLAPRGEVLCMLRRIYLQYLTCRHKTRDAALLCPPLLQGKGGLMSLINGGDMQLLCNVS